MNVGTPSRIIVAQVFESLEIKKKNSFCSKARGVEFAAALTEASRYNNNKQS